MINPTLDDIYENEITPGTGSPEKSLLAALLVRSILDLFGNKTATKQHSPQREAREWLESDHDKEKEFSYRWICAHLDIDADNLRDALFERLERGDRVTIERVKRC